MPKLLPDQSFYPSPTMAMQAPAETLAYVALLNPDPGGHDALAVLDVNPASPGYGAQIARVEMPGTGDELHHFGWNACSSCLCPYSPHPHMRRRYLVVPGMRSSRIHILDTEPDPARPRIVKVIEADGWSSGSWTGFTVASATKPPAASVKAMIRSSAALVSSASSWSWAFRITFRSRASSMSTAIAPSAAPAAP